VPTVTDSRTPKTAPSAHGTGGSLERVTVNLTNRSSKALDVATGLTGDSKTDTINRALQIYAFLEEVTSKGGSIYVKESGDTELQRLKVF
jgi:hypothetical protein